MVYERDRDRDVKRGSVCDKERERDNRYKGVRGK